MVPRRGLEREYAVGRLVAAKKSTQALEDDLHSAQKATKPVLGAFTELGRRLTRGIGRAEHQQSVASLARRIEHGKLAIVDRVMSAPVGGVQGSTWFDLVDTVDVQLRLARLVQEGDVVVPGRGRERGYITGRLKAAEKAERTLEAELRSANPPSPPVTSEQQIDASRAVVTYDAMQQYFYSGTVYPGDTSGLYVESYPPPQSGKRYSYLWPFSRALVGTITLSGVPSDLLGGASYQADVGDRLMGLSRYWDSTSTGPGYDSYPPAPYGSGGDKYYDDQAWVGLALAQNYQMTGNPSSLASAENVFNFVYPGGWAGNATFAPGGLYWVQQGVGAGLTNHSRTTNSTVPNAELALLLENFNPVNAAEYDAAASGIYEWANHYLYNVESNPTDPNGPNPNFQPSQPALMFDNVSGNAIDETLWTYNQGAMIAANVGQYRKTGQSAYLADAEAIANTALGTFSESDYIDDQSAAFNAIFFRGLLLLYSATSDTVLQSKIIQAIQTYADDAWNYYRSSEGLFRFPSSSGAGYQLLDQGAMLQIYAALAWSSSDYPKLP